MVVAGHSLAQSGEEQASGFPGPDEVGVKNVEAQAYRAFNDDCLLGVFAHLGIQRDDEHLSLRLWCPTSKPIFDLPSAMNTSTRSRYCRAIGACRLYP